MCTCSSGGWKSTFLTYRSGTFLKCWQFVLFYSFCFKSPTFAVLPSSPAWKKCLEYELCGLEAFEVAPATFDLLPAVEGNICAWETRRGNEHKRLCYLKSRLIYNHVNGGQVSVFFYITKWRSENRIQAASRRARLADRLAAACLSALTFEMLHMCFFLFQECCSNTTKKRGKKVERSFQPVTFFWGIHTARPRGCLMFQRWDAMHTTSPVFKFRLVVKRVSAVKQSRSTHRPLSDTERWRLSCCIRKRSTVFTISSAG